MIFSNIFLPIWHNIGLYIYIVKYKSGTKIPDFLQNIFFLKKYFHAYGQILKTFPSIFSLKNLHLSHVLKVKQMDIITGL